MRLYFYCSSCQEENSFKTKAKDRFDLQKERGNFINERCRNCGTVVKRRINRVHAKPNKWLLIIGGLGGTFIALMLIFFLPLFITVFIIPAVFGIPFIAWRAEDKKASAFNKVMISDG